MLWRGIVITLAVLLTLAGAIPVAASDDEESGPQFYEGPDGLSVGGLWYLSYQHTDDSSRTTVKRGYINVKKKILSWASWL